MKILTLVRQVPDAESGLRITGGAIDLNDAQMVLDTMDEYGVEQAVRFREADPSIQVIALAVGPEKNEAILRTAMAIGADSAIQVKTDIVLDPISLSKVVARIASAEEASLIFCGGRQSDWDSEALGAAVAERLGWPQLTWTSQLYLAQNTVSGRHDVDNGSESFSVQLPAVVTTQQGLNDPRYPTLPNIMKARKKEIRTESLEAYGVTPLVRTTKAELQDKTRLRQIVAAPDPEVAAAKLAEILRAEAKVQA